MPIPNEIQTKKQFSPNFNNETFQSIYESVFYKNDILQVNKDVDLAFIELLKNDVSDDAVVRANILNSWFAIKKLVSLIETKDLPENVNTIVIHSDL